MNSASPPLIALPGPDELPAWNPKNPALCVSASWSMGGAQKICAEWLAACAERGRRAELAIVWPKTEEMWIHPAWKVIRRHPSQTVRHFLGGLALDWAARYPGCPASAHLLNNDALGFLAEGGARAIPVLHNDPAGWNGAPESWSPDKIPMALGCAPFVQKAGAESNPALHWSNIRHIPSSWRSAKASGAGQGLRKKWKIPEDAKLLLCLGSFKTQKNYPMAARVLKELASLGHNAYLAILGGVSAGDGEALAQTVAEAKALGIASRLRLPGFVADPGAFIACSDLLLNVSLYEGFPMAAIEALQSGLPALVPDFPGFQGFAAQGLCLYPPGSPACEVARLAAAMLSEPRPPFDSVKRCPRLWNMQFALRPKDPAAPPLDGGALFVTANLNMGGAQRSLVNLLGHWDACPPPFPVALAVCADSNQPDFPRACAAFKSVHVFKIGKPDAIDCAENILDLACRSGCKSIVFWNADVKLKLLLAKFAPPGLRICDVSPGDYAFERIAAQQEFCQSITFGPQDYGSRLDLLVQKWDSPAPPFIKSKTLRIPNGAQAPAFLSPEPALDAPPAFLVSGRIAPSKKIETIMEAFLMFRSKRPGAAIEFYGQAEACDQDYAAEIRRRYGWAARFLGPCPDLSFYSKPYLAQITLGICQGCPNAVLEAAFHGLPCIANDSGGTREILLADPADPCGILLDEHAGAGELFEAMEALAAGPALAAALRKAGPARCAPVFGMQAMADAYASALGSL